MTIVLRRVKEEDAFLCDECETTWKDSWLETKDVGWCPFCGTENIPTTIVRLEKLKTRKKMSDPDYRNKRLSELSTIDYVADNMEEITKLEENSLSSIADKGLYSLYKYYSS